MKVLFLDIDGVINTYPPYIDKVGCTVLGFDKLCIDALNLITETTDCQIVISSSWRVWENFDWNIVFEKNGIHAKFLSITPVLEDIRGAEIQQWLNDWKGEEIESFVILDDYDDMGELLPHLVLTHPRTGLTMQSALEAIEILRGEK